jgi:hypothetical protein
MLSETAHAETLVTWSNNHSQKVINHISQHEMRSSEHGCVNSQAAAKS